MRRVRLATVQPGPCRPQHAFSRTTLRRLTTSVGRSNIFRPVVLQRPSPSLGHCRIVTNRQHFQTSGLTNGAAVPTVMQAVDSSRVVRITILRGLRHRSLAPLRRTRTCRSLVSHLRLARTRITRGLNGDQPCVTGCLQLLKLPRPIGSVLRSRHLSVKRTHALLKLGSRQTLIGLTRHTIGRGLAIQRLRRLITRRGRAIGSTGPTGGGTAIGGPTCIHRTRRRLRDQFNAGIIVATNGQNNGIRVPCASSSSLAQVLSLLKIGFS